MSSLALFGLIVCLSLLVGLVTVHAVMWLQGWEERRHQKHARRAVREYFQAMLRVPPYQILITPVEGKMTTHHAAWDDQEALVIFVRALQARASHIEVRLKYHLKTGEQTDVG